MKKKRLLFALIALFCLGTAADAQTVAPLFKCSKNLDNPYGMCAHLTRQGGAWDYSTMERQLTLMNELGIGNVRSDIDYDAINSTNTGAVDTVIAATKRHNIEFLAIAYDIVFSKRQSDITYKDYLNIFTNHYSDKLKYVEFCNEIDLLLKGAKVKQEDVPQVYLADLPSFYKEVKQKNKKIKVTSSGFADVERPTFDPVMAGGGYNYFDILNFHSYVQPEYLAVKFDVIRRSMDKYHWNMPVWLTETGVATHESKDTINTEAEYKRREKRQAQWVARYYLVSFAYGVDKVFWYKFRSHRAGEGYGEDNFGILNEDLSPRPAFYAYKTLVEMCPDKSTRPTLDIVFNTYRAEWTRPDKKHVVALWNRQGERGYEIDTSKPCKLYDYMGKEVPKPKNGKIRISTGVTYCVYSE